MCAGTDYRDVAGPSISTSASPTIRRSPQPCSGDTLSCGHGFTPASALAAMRLLQSPAFSVEKRAEEL